MELSTDEKFLTEWRNFSMEIGTKIKPKTQLHRNTFSQKKGFQEKIIIFYKTIISNLFFRIGLETPSRNVIRNVFITRIAQAANQLVFIKNALIPAKELAVLTQIVNFVA